MTTPEEQAAEVLREAEVAAAIYAHTGETCHAPECGDGFGYHDLDTREDRRRGCQHIAEALAPLFAEERRKGAEAGWDEGYFLGVGLPAKLGHTFRNPYRERADTYAEGGER